MLRDGALATDGSPVRQLAFRDVWTELQLLLRLLKLALLRAHALDFRREAPLGHEFFHQLCYPVAYPSFRRAHRSLDQRGLTLVDLPSSECHLTVDTLWMLLQCQIEVTLRLHP